MFSVMTFEMLKSSMAWASSHVVLQINSATCEDFETMLLLMSKTKPLKKNYRHVPFVLARFSVYNLA